MAEGGWSTVGRKKTKKTRPLKSTGNTCTPCTQIHTHAHICIRTRPHTHDVTIMQSRKHVILQIHAHVYAHPYIDIHKIIIIYIYIYNYMRTYVRTYVYVYKGEEMRRRWREGKGEREEGGGEVGGGKGKGGK